MPEKSETCFNKRDGKPLSVYYSEYEAKESADYSKRNFGLDLYPYQCDVCGKWHLSPKDRQTPSRTCSCVDSTGKYKELYETKSAAQRRAEIIEEEQGLTLKVYPCPIQAGWHLTKKVEEHW